MLRATSGPNGYERCAAGWLDGEGRDRRKGTGGKGGATPAIPGRAMMVGAGCWVLGAGCWVLGAGWWVLGGGMWVVGGVWCVAGGGC